MKLTLLPSDKGDCMLLEAPDKTTILIDGGMPDSYTGHVREFLGQWRNKNKRPLDLVYLSHIDEDHIGGVLQLMNDLVDWRVFRHKSKNGEPVDQPDFPEPPEIKRIWHNAFQDMVPKEAVEIASLLAARAAQLSNSIIPEAQNLGAAYQAIAASVPQAIRLSRRVSAKQLNIPLNKEFGGKLAMTRTPAQKIRLNGKNSPLIRVLGPFQTDLEALQKVWIKWLEAEKNKGLKKVRKEMDEEDARFESGVLALDVDDQLGKRAKVTEENLASLMLLVEHKGQSIVLTGDGHFADIEKGLDHNGITQNHFNVLKVQHHGSEHNFKREFAKRVTADHYIICGNGLHDNPDPRVLDVLVQSRIGNDEQRSSNPEAKGKTFHVWFNCSTKFLKREIARKKKSGQSTAKLESAMKFFGENVEKKMNKFAADSKGKLKLHYLDDKPLVLDLGN
jgi:beta-lactamase superfamily II metal-dependent hydrolase